MSRRSGKRVALGIFAVLVLGLTIPPFVNVNRYRAEVGDAISRALGHPASVESVSLRVFPQPGFKLDNLIVADDPAINAEPLLRAEEVRAALRLSSLWRGRLEIAQLSLSNASLNLVRGQNGHWNLETLLEHVSQTPAAPTGKPRPESRPRFPYIEAENGRINLKIGQEKKVYVLSETDFALWLDSEKAWQLRLAGRPLRTDTAISDTGIVRISGSVQRAERLAETMLSLRVILERAQLGQLTKLIYGRDRGWRGGVNVSAKLEGTPAHLRVAGDAAIEDFRRYDIYGGGSLRLAVHCSATYSSSSDSLSEVACDAPVGKGRVSLTAELSGLSQARRYRVVAAATGIPAPALVFLARHMKSGLSDDLDAEGTVDAGMELRKDAGQSERLWAGWGTTSGLLLRSRAMDVPLELGSLQFALMTLEAAGGAIASLGQGGVPVAPPNETVLAAVPFPLRLSSTAPAKVRAWFWRTGYNVQVQGDARIERLLQVADALGLPAPSLAATGAARVNLQVAGAWTGFAPPVITGTAQLRDVTAQVDGLPKGVQIATANLALSPSEVTLQNVAASMAGTHLSFAGWVRRPRSCEVAEECAAEFLLRADSIDTEELNLLFNPRFSKRPWYAIVRGESKLSSLLKLNAHGFIAARRLTAGLLPASNASAEMRLQQGLVTLSNLRADVLGGKHAGELRADFRGKEPTYALHGSIDHLSMAAVAGIMRDEWATGHASVRYRGSASGWGAEDLRDSAAGSLAFTWRDGLLAHIALDGHDAPLQVRRFDGQLALRQGMLALSASKLEAASGIYVVSGTASLERELNLRLARDGGRSYSLTGTLNKPRVVSSGPETRAALKP